LHVFVVCHNHARPCVLYRIFASFPPPVRSFAFTYSVINAPPTPPLPYQPNLPSVPTRDTGPIADISDIPIASEP
jgi:hypothetical protein